MRLTVDLERGHLARAIHAEHRPKQRPAATARARCPRSNEQTQRSLSANQAPFPDRPAAAGKSKGPREHVLKA